MPHVNMFFHMWDVNCVHLWWQT